MTSLILYHHLGLGDHIMCHGIVREYCAKYKKVAIFSRSNNYKSVCFMFRDLKNLEIIEGDDRFAREFISKNVVNVGESRYNEVKILGFENLNRQNGTPLEKQFYDMAGLDILKKWGNFHVERDLEREKTLFNTVAPKIDYVFLHEDTERKYTIKRKYVGKNLRIFLPNTKITKNIFDYCTIIERAKEIHVIDSSFMFLIDCLDYINPDQKLYIHRYSRENNEWQLPILKKDWCILTPESGNLDLLKKFLESLYHSKIPLFDNSFSRRTIRKIFRDMGWIMGRPQKPDLIALIRRHAPGKSFTEVVFRKNGGDENVVCAKNSGATKVTSVDINSTNAPTNSNIIFFSESLENSNLQEVIKKLRSITKEILIFNTRSTLKNNKEKTTLTPKTIESVLLATGFKIREKHIFQSEVCFVCRIS